MFGGGDKRADEMENMKERRPVRSSCQKMSCIVKNDNDFLSSQLSYPGKNASTLCIVYM